MDVLTSPETRLIWTITDDSLNEYGVTLDGHKITQANLNFLDRPVRLVTPNLVLNLPPVIPATDMSDRIEFPTGNIVTPLQILGAIYTYYSLPVSEALSHLPGGSAPGR